MNENLFINNFFNKQINRRSELREGYLTASQSEREERLSRRREHDRVRRQNETDEESQAKFIMVLQNEMTGIKVQHFAKKNFIF